MKFHHLVLGVSSVLALTACGNGDSGSESETATFSRIHSEIIVGKCGGQGCHGSDLGGNLTMNTASESYDNLVNQPAAGAPCASSGLVRVVPGNPDESLLYTKLVSPPCGVAMPVGGMLSGDEIEMIRAWIANGAPNN